MLLRLFKLSWRNIFRNKRRSLLTLTILAMGSTGLILVGGFFENISLGYREQFIHSQTGHLQIGREGYFEKGASDPFAYLMKDVAQIQEETESLPHVLFTVPRLKLSGMASSEKASVSVLALGVDPVREHRMGDHKASNSKVKSTQIVEGSDLDTADPYGAVLGKGLMKALNLKIGDTFNLITTREAGAIDGMEFHVRGAFETIVKDFDDRGMKVDLVSAQKLLGLENEVHSLLVVLDETRHQNVVQKGLAQIIRSKNLKLEVIPWETQGLFYRQSKALLDKIYSTILLIMCVIFFFSIANTINMALFERIREFGTMMAMGNSRWVIFSLIFFEATFLGLLGAVLGLTVGCGISSLVSWIGIEMPPPPNGSSGYLAMISLKPQLLFEIGVIAFASTLFASVIPAYRACHFRIIHALGYV